MRPSYRKVVALVAEGYTNQQIADALGLARRSVKAYLAAIYDKLGVRNRVELTLWHLEQPKG